MSQKFDVMFLLGLISGNNVYGAPFPGRLSDEGPRPPEKQFGTLWVGGNFKRDLITGCQGTDGENEAER